MAKKKNPQELIEEAKIIMIEARKKQAALIQEAKEMEEKKFADIGKKCIEYLKGNISKESLEVFVKNNDVVIESDLEIKDGESIDV